MDEMEKCPHCGESVENSIGRGHGQVQCKGCNKFYLSDKTSRNTEGVVENGNSREIIQRSSIRITSLEQLISQCEIDTTEWEIERWVCNKWEVGAKDANKELQVEPLFQIKVWLKRKVIEIRARDAISRMIEDARQFAPVYPEIQYQKSSDDLLYEIGFPDLHFGRLTWNEESGEDYDVKIAEKAARESVGQLLAYVKGVRIGRILLPLGNDFFNVNGSQETTFMGTKQNEDTRWQKTFVLARRLLVELVDSCSTIAPVDVLIVPGNHDKERMFYMGDALECWFHNNPNVKVNNQAARRKYYSFGANLIGFTHGSDEKLSQLPSIMAYESPELWGGSIHREWHLGDKHHKADLIHKTREENGVVIRILRSLAALDEWTYTKGYIGAERAAEGFLWHPRQGVVAQYTAGIM